MGESYRSAHSYRALRAGQRLVFSAKRLHDGTFRAGTLRVRGAARHVFMRGTVVRQRASRYLLSAGGTLIGVRVSSHAFASAVGRHRPGDIVGGTVRVGPNGLTASSFKTLGHEDGLYPRPRRVVARFAELAGHTLERRADALLRVNPSRTPAPGGEAGVEQAERRRHEHAHDGHRDQYLDQ